MKAYQVSMSLHIKEIMYLRYLISEKNENEEENKYIKNTISSIRKPGNPKCYMTFEDLQKMQQKPNKYLRV